MKMGRLNNECQALKEQDAQKLRGAIETDSFMVLRVSLRREPLVPYPAQGRPPCLSVLSVLEKLLGGSWRR